MVALSLKAGGKKWLMLIKTSTIQDYTITEYPHKVHEGPAIIPLIQQVFVEVGEEP